MINQIAFLEEKSECTSSTHSCLFSTKSSKLNFFVDNYQNNQNEFIKKKKIFKVYKFKRNEYNCNINNCKKIFTKKWIFERHLKSHFYKRENFTCEVKNCGKKYKKYESLKIHYNSKHLMIKQYKCRFCVCEFNHRNSKLIHERKFHAGCMSIKCADKSNYLIIKLFRLCSYFYERKGFKLSYESMSLMEYLKLVCNFVLNR
jgi:hypothetical protein